MSPVGSAALRTALIDLGRAKATGQLVLRDDSGHQACIQFDEGDVVSLQMPDHRPRIGMRLVAAGMLSPDQLTSALEVQRRRAEEGKEPGRIGDLLVRSGAVTRETVEHVARAQLADNLASLLTWQATVARFDAAARARAGGELGVPAGQLLAEADARKPVLERLLQRLGGSGAVPELIGLPTIDPNPALGPHDWALLCKIDGRRSVEQLADACGFTMLEAAQTLDGLISAGMASAAGQRIAKRHQADVDTAALMRELSSFASGSSSARRPGGSPAISPPSR